MADDYMIEEGRAVEEDVSLCSESAIDFATLDKIANSGEQDEGSEHGEGELKSPEMPMRDILFPVVSIIADKFAPAWELDDKEKLYLASGWGDVIDYYFPDVIGTNAPIVAAFAATFAVLGDRINKPRYYESEAQTVEESVQQTNQSQLRGEVVTKGAFAGHVVKETTDD